MPSLSLSSSGQPSSSSKPSRSSASFGHLSSASGTAVAVVVVVGAAVVVLEAVLVLGDQRALVAVVLDAVAVAVAHVGRVADRDEEPRVGRADRLVEAGAAADRDRERAARR